MSLKKEVGVLSLMVVAIICVACETKDASVGNAEVVTMKDSVHENAPAAIDVILGTSEEDLLVMNTEGFDRQEEEEAVADDRIVIYYSSKDFSHLMKERQIIKQKSPDVILSALARHNIVTLDTKQEFFEVEKTEEGKTRITLDLNKKFGAYLNTMSADSEQIILAALTHTFLDNYRAKELLLTVDGKPLETTHNTYDDVLVRSSYEIEKVEK